MDTSSAESRDRLRKAIDDELNSSEEFTRALKSRRNALAPISRLPPEILATIFSLLPPSTWNKEAGHLEWIRVGHVCRLWRETALNHPRLWSYINFTKLTPAAAVEILARAKMAPLHVAADFTRWSVAHPLFLESQLEAHISHTCHLRISGHLQAAIERLVSSAPTLEFLSLLHKSFIFSSSHVVIPVNLFNGTIPRLTSLELENCDISWKSLLLKGLQTLKILSPSTEARPKVEDWLGALNEMPQLETLILENATPIAPPAGPLISQPSRAATLPSLTRFHISASARDCALALAYLVLPALTELRVDAESQEWEGGDVQLLIPYVARNVCGLLDTEPLRSILISCERTRIEVVAWAMPDADLNLYDPNTSNNELVPRRLTFAATSRSWKYGVDTAIFDAVLMHIPVNSVSTLTTTNCTRLSKEFWLSHAPRWPLLDRARLVPASIKAFRDMLAEDAPPDGPRLPLLTNLTLVNVMVTAPRTFHLCDMLMERVEQGVPLEVLDLRACFAADRAIQLLREVVVDVQEPRAAGTMSMEGPAFFNWNGGVGYCSNEVEYDHDGRGLWYDETYDEEDGDEDEDEDEAEYDEFMDYDYDDDYDAVSML
ncbi:hypothetical protein DFH94DRAFT_404420 [Russula ochroleuca]|jgi:hypothetical protein|uniref:F-box domain-containing protein n=1 Tax=Russula ochroleuca TaxID=152965 RepID=A0A9P5MY30_9AGAM|nr:hypothetical protein DFH94DRAFT_404420 [Russula ochroleuca]